MSIAAIHTFGPHGEPTHPWTGICGTSRDDYSWCRLRETGGHLTPEQARDLHAFQDAAIDYWIGREFLSAEGHFFLLCRVGENSRDAWERGADPAEYAAAQVRASRDYFKTIGEHENGGESWDASRVVDTPDGPAVPRVCADCGRPAYYDLMDDNYHHAVDAVDGCFLIASESRPDDPDHPLCKGDERMD